ncbi:MAG: 2-oxoglutarate and iron-dependent oxygenase domain-containing protein, partial [Pseudomonadota bacterium]
MQAISTIDFTGLRASSDGEAYRACARQIIDAFSDTGFIVAINHGIDSDVISALRAQVIGLFRLPQSDLQ